MSKTSQKSVCVQFSWIVLIYCSKHTVFLVDCLFQICVLLLFKSSRKFKKKIIFEFCYCVYILFLGYFIKLYILVPCCNCCNLTTFMHIFSFSETYFFTRNFFGVKFVTFRMFDCKVSIYKESEKEKTNVIIPRPGHLHRVWREGNFTDSGSSPAKTIFKSAESSAARRG